MEDRSLTIEETLQSIDDTLKRIEDFLHNGRSISVSYRSGNRNADNLVKKDVNKAEI